MKNQFIPVVSMTADASGAAGAAQRGDVVAVVDIIDMSTTLEAALEAGAAAVFGASPDRARAPVPLNPERVGFAAGRSAVKAGAGVIIVAEPRVGSNPEREGQCRRVINGIEEAGSSVELIVPNMGADTVHLVDFNGKIVVAVTASGGTAFDAAFLHSEDVFTVTAARTAGMRGSEPVEKGAARVCSCAVKKRKNIAIAAASSRSLEDVLAAQYITSYILQRCFEF